mmetsp:Transcript_4290/g.12379  ORF Transcript_4290/g.12379 Transcript_4290/m.12379 type:complete len:288 (-) Transcript_4290:326-1189(-)
MSAVTGMVGTNLPRSCHTTRLSASRCPQRPMVCASVRSAGDGLFGRPQSSGFLKTTAQTAAIPQRTSMVRRDLACRAIGVPRIQYRYPKGRGEYGRMQISAWEALYFDKIIWLGSWIELATSNNVINTLLYLDAEDDRMMHLCINCPGGEVVPMFSIHDTMQQLRCDISTVTYGIALGMAGFVAASGTRGLRAMMPNATMMIHSPSGTARGQASEIVNETGELARVRDYFCEVLGEATMRDPEQVRKDFDRDEYFTAEQAQNYGLIDLIVSKERPLLESLGLNELPS